MKKFIVIALLSVCAVSGNRIGADTHQMLSDNLKTIADPGEKEELREGDMLFQTTISTQSKAVQLATHSKYSHCGILFKEKGEFYVLEAVQPVKKTPLKKWIANGKRNHYIVRRLKNADQVLTPAAIEKMKAVGQEFYGKNYDYTFEWSDNKIYCSELIYKVYQRGAGVEIGKLQQLRDFDLSSKPVQRKLKQRYGDKVPMDETVISPSGVFESELLETVREE